MAVIRTPKDGEEPDESGMFRPDQMRRERAGAATSLPARTARRAELVCRRVQGRPALLGAVVPKDAPLEVLRLSTRRSSTPLGSEVTIECPCGIRHLLHGPSLVAAVRDAPRPTKGRVPSIDVSGVSSDQGD
ncbi:hypothetical protein ASF37_11725 [Aeromicrobium sp. Leaf289]|nr:hypothetical protein ASF37_11725 [Aeromicrobium sp. Leaf289]